MVTAPIVFSALDATVAGEVEPAFAQAGKFVLSNAKNFRMEPDVPLVIPEVNGGHLALLDAQRKKRGWNGAIVTNANCSAIVAVVPLAPLHQGFGIKQLFVATMQAVSGAGYPGVPSLDILGNVIPYIGDEEPKIEPRCRSCSAPTRTMRSSSATFTVSAHANRVPVEHGHTVCMSIGFEEKPTPEAAIADNARVEGIPRREGLPTRPSVRSSSPTHPTARSRGATCRRGNGMTVMVGRVRPDPVFDVKLVAMGHNTVRGAAGASVLNAELLAVNGALDSA